MIGALLLGLVAGAIGRMLVPDMWSGMSGPKSWLFSLVLGLAGAALGYLVFTEWLGIGDTDVFDWGGIVGAIIGVIILLPFVGIVVRATRAAKKKSGSLSPALSGLDSVQHGLLDELPLWVHPLIVGGGPDALIYRDGPLTSFELTETTPLKSGTVILRYRAR